MRLLFLMALVVSFSMSNAQLNIDYQEFQLDNGLDVIMHKDNSSPTVSVSIMYHVGSKNENPERTGFAHFFEHLLFEGTKNIPRGEYSRYVESAGGTLNANTTFDRTYYFEILPSNELELGLWLESERLMHAIVDNKGVETQRLVVKEERRQRTDNQPYGSILEESMVRAYPDYPYSWPIIGSMDHLDAATESDYKDFYRTFYVPNNAVLVVAGDLEYAETKELVTKYFGMIPKGVSPIPRPNKRPAPLTGEVRDTVYDNIQLPAVVQVYRTVGMDSPDYYAVDMAAQLLSQGESSRFNKSLVDEQQLALFVGSFPLGLEDPGVVLAFGIVNGGVTPDALEAGMDAEVAKIQSELMSDEEFEKLRNQIEVGLINQNAGLAGVAENLANAKTYFDDASRVNTELNRYLAVTKEDIMMAAQKYFKKDSRVVLYYMPKAVNP
ncbi:insulinase family protein [Saprospiraceae bacterium]|nr:insulinase family protein [Saprospiraceae bacterium]